MLKGGLQVLWWQQQRQQQQCNTYSMWVFERVHQELAEHSCLCSRYQQSTAASAAAAAAAAAAAPRALHYADLGGVEDVLADIQELIEYPLKHPEVSYVTSCMLLCYIFVILVFGLGAEDVLADIQELIEYLLKHPEVSLLVCVMICCPHYVIPVSAPMRTTAS
jgi:hypothetical protein